MARVCNVDLIYKTDFLRRALIGCLGIGNGSSWKARPLQNHIT